MYTLTKENSNDIERVQKTALKLILKEKYKSYENALEILGLENLEQRREYLCLMFAKSTEFLFLSANYVNMYN